MSFAIPPQAGIQTLVGDVQRVQMDSHVRGNEEGMGSNEPLVRHPEPA
jgi:hypothetical protein